MGKKGLSDKVRAKRKETSKHVPNPFEVKVNKVKNVVVNKKLQSWEKGLPGISRSKAVKKRKDTLLRELHHSKKSNFLLDKRFGEGDSSLTADEKMVQRFALEKKKQLQGKDFNLDDNEETLTHYGQSLAENLQDTVHSESDDDDEQAVKAVTGDLQFGGLTTNESNVSWKDKMKDIIADSKKQKYERQAQKEKVVETTSELDTIWKTVVPSFERLMQRDPPSRKPSNYMMLFHNLVMEQKSAGASDKLKTDEEKAKEEAENLQVLEAQRLSRMKGDTNETKLKHVSADDLNDGFALEPQKHRVSFSNLSNTNEEEGLEDEENEDGDQDKEDESGAEESSEEEDEDNSDDEDEEVSDNFSDLASDENEEDDDEEHGSGERLKGSDKKVSSSGNKEATIKPILKKHETKPLDKKISGKKNSELPFVYSAPGSFEEFAALLHGHSSEEQNIILSRLRKCHHPSLAEGNKDKLENIFKYLMQYFGKLTSSESIDSMLIKSVTSHLWEMSQMFPAAAASYLQEWLLDQQKQCANSVQHRKNAMSTCVHLHTMLHLSLIEGTFPTSDYRHPVTTPALCFISQILSECCVKSMRDCVIGLFLSAQAIQFVGLSKRYIPELVTFLHGLLVLGADENEASGVKTFPPLKANNKRHDLLQVQNKCDVSGEWSITEMRLNDSLDLETDNYRCGAIAKTVDILQKCIDLWEDLPDVAAAMKPLKEPLSILPVQNYPESLKASIHHLKMKIRETDAKKLQVMQLPAKKPEPLKLFEPKVEEFWSGKKKKGGPNRELNERQRLSHKIKREMKAAVREIKRDNEVLATHQLEVITRKDAERKRKTKDLMNSLANQEGDYKAIKRAKH